MIRSPVITEKATAQSEQNKVVFNVAADATKPQIKEAVEHKQLALNFYFLDSFLFAFLYHKEQFCFLQFFLLASI